MGSFSLEDLEAMCKLVTPEIKLDEKFLDAFVRKEVTDMQIQIPELIKEWNGWLMIPISNQL